MTSSASRRTAGESWIRPPVYVPEVVIDAQVALPRDAEPALGQPRPPPAAARSPTSQIRSARRLREAAPPEEQVRPDQAVVAQLVRLPDRLRAQPELVGVGRRRADREDHRGDAPPEHARRR